MSVANIASQTQVYDSYSAQNAAKTSDTAKKEDAAKKSEVAKNADAKNDGVVYDKSNETSDSSKKATYSVNKMSADDRAALVKQLKADQESLLPIGIFFLLLFIFTFNLRSVHCYKILMM